MPQTADLSSILFTAGVSAVTAVLTLFITATLTARQERMGDWRKLKLAQYQEFVAALSAVADGRVTPAAQARFADAVNAMGLVASPQVLLALNAFVEENSSSNPNRTETGVVQLTDELVQAMRKDIHPALGGEAARDPKFSPLVPPRDQEG